MNEQEKENIINDIVDELHCRSQIGGIIHSDRFRVVAESLVKKLNLHFVSQQSELLKAYDEFAEAEYCWYLGTEDDTKEGFLKAFNYC